MKTFLLTSLLIFSFSYVTSQESKSSYKFNTIYSINGKQFKPGYRVKVISSTDDEVFFRVYRFISKKAEDDGDKLNKTFFKSDENIIEYKISKEDFNTYTNQIYPAFKGVKAGFYTIPFKLRFNDFDFEQNINFGMNIGFQYRFNRELQDRWIYEPSLGIGLSSINLNTKNSDVEKERSASAFTLSTGMILRFDSTINLGLFVGLDFLGNNDQDINWKHDGKPWLGIGINVGFSVSKSKENDFKNKADNGK